MEVEIPGSKRNALSDARRSSLERLNLHARRISATPVPLVVAARAFILLAASHIFANAAVADKCRSCEFSSGVPPELWQDFSRSLDALEKFTLADEALARRLSNGAGMQARSGSRVIGDPALQRFIYPWKPEFWHGGIDDFRRTDAGEAPQSSDDTPSKPTWLSVPYSSDGGDQRLTVSGDEMRAGAAVATQARTSGKWYWEVRYRPGTANLPHMGLVGVLDPAEADFVHNPEERITAVPIPEFAGLLGGEYLQFALDLDGRTLHYGVNGNWSSDPQEAAFGIPLASRTAFAPAVIPSSADLYPYIADKFEFNFGGTTFRHPIPAGYRPFDISPGMKPSSPQMQRQTPIAQNIYERAFLGAIHAFEQPFDSTTKAKLRETIESWRAYRNGACRLSATFKKQKGSGMDANCMRAFGGALLAALPQLQEWNRLSFDPPFDELPPIDLEQHPILHYVEVDENDVSKDTAVLEAGRMVATVHVTDTSGPLILFLRAYGGTHWRITVNRGVKLQHVFLFGQYKQAAKLSGSGAPIRSYSGEQDKSGKLWKVLYRGEHDPTSLAAGLEELIGVAPSSIQQDCKNARCEIAAVPSKVATGESP